MLFDVRECWLGGHPTTVRTRVAWNPGLELVRAVCAMTRSGAQPEILIGCPVIEREWVIERWLEHVGAATSLAGVAADVLLLGPTRDLTFVRGREVARRIGIRLIEVDSGEEVGSGNRGGLGAWRVWNERRLIHMVWLRNQLLGAVRELGPRFFLSLDSDVLLHEMSLAYMLETCSTFDFAAVGGKTNMTPRGEDVPNCAWIEESGRLARRSAASVSRVDVLMAIKLMTPAAYMIDYEFDSRGEDVGWSIACARNGLGLGWDGRSTSEHVMAKDV